MRSNEVTKVLYYEGEFDQQLGKFLNSLIRYKRSQIAGVFSTEPKESLKTFLSENDIPLITDLDNLNSFDQFVITSLHFDEQSLAESSHTLETVLDAGKTVVNGSHLLLSNRFEKYKNQIVDLRKKSSEQNLFTGKLIEKKGQTRILTVGVDCNIGKMTTSLELYEHMKNLDYDVEFVPTGQIGMSIHGKGIPLDSSVVDFTSGLMEEHLLGYDNKFLVIEGQGSIFTPLYSGLTLAQVHGCVPDYMILCLDAARKHPRYCPNIRLPETQKAISAYEEAAGLVRPGSKVIGISVNTSSLNEDSAKDYIKHLNEETNLPVFDPVRKRDFDKILEALNHENRNTDVNRV